MLDIGAQSVLEFQPADELTLRNSSSLTIECYVTGGEQETEGGRGKGEQGQAGAGGLG